MKLEFDLGDGKAAELVFTRIKDSRHLPGNCCWQCNLFRVESAMLCKAWRRCDGDVSWGLAFCSRREPGGFDEAKGRRKALARAIKNWPQADRTDLWAAYNEKFPPEKEGRRAPSAKASSAANRLLNYLSAIRNPYWREK